MPHSVWISGSEARYLLAVIVLWGRFAILLEDRGRRESGESGGEMEGMEEEDVEEEGGFVSYMAESTHWWDNQVGNSRDVSCSLP